MPNLPFKKIRQFINYALAIGGKCIVLVCPERLWACKKGWEQFHRHRRSLSISIGEKITWGRADLGSGPAISIWESPNAFGASTSMVDRMSDDYGGPRTRSHPITWHPTPGRYLENRFPGESAKEWLERTSKFKTCPYVPLKEQRT